MKRAIFTAGLRTPFGRAFKGAYLDTRADDLLVELLRSQVDAHPEFVSAGVDDLVVGCAYPEGEQGFNVARMAALGAGLEVPGVTVNRLCASSLEAVSMAAARARSGWGNLFLTAGIESMSRIPRRGASFSESDLIQASSPHAYIAMGNTGCRSPRANARAPRPILLGRHLIDSGIEPGPKMGQILEAAFEAQLDGQFDDLEGALAWLEQEFRGQEPGNP